jgi:hypothetical protein
MTTPRKNRLESLERGAHPLLVGATEQQEPSRARPAADVDETEEAERLGRAAFTALHPVRIRVPAELDEPRLVRVQFQSEVPQSPAQFVQEHPSVFFSFEAHGEVIGIAHDDYVAARSLLSPFVEPEVEDVVQVDVRQ